MRSTFKDIWKKSVEEEVSALKEREKFEVTSLPPGEVALPHLWVFAVKANLAGRVARF